MRVRTLTYLTICLLCANVKGTGYTSVYDLEIAVKGEANLIEKLEKLPDKHNITQLLEFFKEQHEQIGDDIHAYVGVPMNGYRLVKRLTLDRYKLINLLNEESKEKLQNFTQEQEEAGLLPTYEDLIRTLESLERLQSVYKLKAKSMAKGIINNVQYAREMTGPECFELAELFYQNGIFYFAFEWFTTASEHFLDEKDVKMAESWKITTLYKMRFFEDIPYHNFVTFFDKDCTDQKFKQSKIDKLYLGYSEQLKHYNETLTPMLCYENGLEAFGRKNWLHTILWMVDFLQRQDNDDLFIVDALIKAAEASANLENYNYALEFLEMPQVKTEYGNHTRVLELTTAYKESIAQGEGVKGYELDDRFMNTKMCNYYSRLCRGDELRSIESLSSLRCKLFNDKLDPYLRLAPLKMEELNLEPYIVTFHNVISDNEIEFLKNQVINSSSFTQSGVSGYTFETSKLSKKRVSKNGWISPNEYEVVNKISRRVQDITKANLDLAEALQVANYGPGGHYSLHYDFFGDQNATGQNRLATFMFYLSDVEEGGATAFQYVSLAVFPRKGSAVLWFNLKSDGIPDNRTLHSGCPVIVGSKWVANKWLHELPDWNQHLKRF